MVENGYLHLLRKFPVAVQTKVSECFISVSKRKKGCCRLIVAPMDALPPGSGNFGYEPSLEKFIVSWGNFFCWGKAPAIIRQHSITINFGPPKNNSGPQKISGPGINGTPWTPLLTLLFLYNKHDKIRNSFLRTSVPNQLRNVCDFALFCFDLFTRKVYS